MCEFIEELEKIKSSSSDSVANKDYTDFNRYMHVESGMDEELENVIIKACEQKKALVLVCGNSGQGKSHLISRAIDRGVFKEDNVTEVYIDATHSDQKGVNAQDTLHEKLKYYFSDEKLDNADNYRLIVAINHGVLSDFLKKYENDYKELKAYIDNNRLFASLPTYRVSDNVPDSRGIFYHVDFTQYNRFALSSHGVVLDFVGALLNRITNPSDNNSIYHTYDNVCCSCTKKDNCPAKYNYMRLSTDEDLRYYLASVLVKSIIKHNFSVSVREINDLFYKCIVGDTFDESLIDGSSIARLQHYIENNVFSNFFNSGYGISNYLVEEDIFSSPSREWDYQYTMLNLMPSFEKWLDSIADERGEVYKQLAADIVFCKNSEATKYSKQKNYIKNEIFKLYMRESAFMNKNVDLDYDKFINYLYSYNIGDLSECEGLFELVVKCFYMWNGSLLNQYGEEISSAVKVSQGGDNYCIYKNMELDYAQDPDLQELSNDEYWKFIKTIRLLFVAKNQKTIHSIDIDYDLYQFMLKIVRGYQPTAKDRKARVKFDTFVRALLYENKSEINIYSYHDYGKRYRFKKNMFGKYVFEEDK